jgi:hypothetical protein
VRLTWFSQLNCREGGTQVWGCRKGCTEETTQESQDCHKRTQWSGEPGCVSIRFCRLLVSETLNWIRACSCASGFQPSRSRARPECKLHNFFYQILRVSHHCAVFRPWRYWQVLPGHAGSTCAPTRLCSTPTSRLQPIADKEYHAHASGKLEYAW